MLDRKTVDYLLEYTCEIFGLSEDIEDIAEWSEE